MEISRSVGNHLRQPSAGICRASEVSVSNKSQANQKAKSALGTPVTFPTSFLKTASVFTPVETPRYQGLAKNNLWGLLNFIPHIHLRAFEVFASIQHCTFVY